MKKALLCLGLVFSISIWADNSIEPILAILTDPPATSPVGENADYVLNDSSERSSWIIKNGKADATVKSYQASGPFGPGYVVEISYDLSVRFKGRQQGTIGLLVPEQIFAANFINELAANHPMSFGSFDLDYHGEASAKDANDRLYNPCSKTRIFNINSNNRPNTSHTNGVYVLYSMGDEIENLEVKMKVHDSVPVVGAVELDVSGKASGISFKAGFDYKP